MGVVLVSSMAISLVVVIIVSLAHKLKNKLWIRPKKMEKYLREQGFSGNPYKFLQGDLKEFSKISKAATSKTMDFSHDIGARVQPYEHHLAHKYGNNSYMWFGAKPRLNIIDPVLVKERLHKPDAFHKIYPDPLADLVVGGLATAHGEKWARHRKIMNRGFDLEKLKGTLPEVYLSCKNMINEWKILVSIEQSSEIDAWPYIVKLARDMISRAVFGSNLEEGRRIFEITEKQADLAVQCMRASYIPWARHFQIKLNNEVKKLNREKMDQLRCIITKRAAEIGNENDKDDLLKVLMEATKKEKQEIGKGMTLEEVIDECKVLYAAGADPTAHVIAWTVILLSKYTDWQTLAREEVLHVLGNKKEFDLEVLNQLKIVTMILYEVLRLYPPAPVLIRATSKKIELANVTIPAFVQLSLPLIFHNHDASIWGGDAKQFNPQRFSEGIPNATRGSSLFFPFSSGPRTCIGQTFAMIEAKMAISMILLNFSFKLSPTYIHAPEFIFLLRPKYGARIILHKI